MPDPQIEKKALKRKPFLLEEKTARQAYIRNKGVEKKREELGRGWGRGDSKFSYGVSSVTFF